MKEITFSIPGEPQGKARPKVVRLKNGMSSTYTPDKSVNYENLIRVCFRDAAGAEFVPMTGIFSVDVTAWFSPPTVWPKSRAHLALDERVVRPTKKPDADNIAKIVADSLNGIAYRDDSAIVHMRISKFYDTRPRVEVVIRDITDIRDSWSRK